MHRLLLAVIRSLTLLAFFAGPTPASADPIRVTITEGSLNMVSWFGPLSIAGDHGFTFASVVGAPFGVFGPQNTCSPCLPGAPVDLRAHWLGSDLPGTATLEGVTYTQVGSLIGPSSGSVMFSGSTTAPLEGLTATSTAPFLFSGLFNLSLSQSGPFTRASLFGSGSATVQFVRPALDAPWSYHSATYQFDAEPVPEPGTLLLFGTALAGLAACRRKRSQTSRPHE